MIIMAILVILVIMVILAIIYHMDLQYPLIAFIETQIFFTIQINLSKCNTNLGH